MALLQHPPRQLAQTPYSAWRLDRPVVIADEVKDVTFAEDGEQRGEGALCRIPGAAGFDEGGVDAAEDVFGADEWVLTAELAPQQAQDALVLAIHRGDVPLLVVAEGRG